VGVDCVQGRGRDCGKVGERGQFGEGEQGPLVELRSRYTVVASATTALLGCLSYIRWLWGVAEWVLRVTAGFELRHREMGGMFVCVCVGLENR